MNSVNTLRNNNSSDTLTAAIGTYWYGPALGPLERACLISMMEQGHSVTLFCHDKVEGVPEGVEICDAREVIGTKKVILHAGTQSPSLFADQFRYHMIHQIGVVWLDLDVFLLKPIKPKDNYLFAWEDNKFINNGILLLPQSSPTLMDLLSFCKDEYPIPPFFSFDRKVKLHFMKAIGKPIHVSRQKWGVWGPRALTWFLSKNQEDHHALESRHFHPIDYRDLSPFFSPSDEVKSIYLNDAIGVHLFGQVLRKKIAEIGGVEKLPSGSYLLELIKLGS